MYYGSERRPSLRDLPNCLAFNVYQVTCQPALRGGGELVTILPGKDDYRPVRVHNEGQFRSLLGVSHKGVVTLVSGRRTMPTSRELCPLVNRTKLRRNSVCPSVRTISFKVWHAGKEGVLFPSPLQGNFFCQVFRLRGFLRPRLPLFRRNPHVRRGRNVCLAFYCRTSNYCNFTRDYYSVRSALVVLRRRACNFNLFFIRLPFRVRHRRLPFFPLILGKVDCLVNVRRFRRHVLATPEWYRVVLRGFHAKGSAQCVVNEGTRSLFDVRFQVPRQDSPLRV